MRPTAARVSSLLFCFERLAFSVYFCTIITFFSLYGEYVVRSPLPDGVFLTCDHALDFLYQLV